jgi:hypothetical protein
MIKYLILLNFVILYKGNAIAQVANSKKVCNCTILMDPDFKGSVGLFSAPAGKVLKVIRHNFEAEDYLVLHVKESAGKFLYVSANYSIAGFIAKGWIKKDKPIGIYSRDYSPKDSLVLYSSPRNWKNKYLVLKESNSKFLSISDCDGDWLKVSIEYNNKTYEGWLPPNMQCANPYTNCN